MVRTGVFQGCFRPDLSMAGCLQLAAELGFDGLEATLEDTRPPLTEALDEASEEILAIGRSVGMTRAREGGLTLDSSPADIHHIAKLAARSGVEVHSVATMLLFTYPLSSPISDVRDTGMRVVLQMLRAAAALGASTVLIVPGLVTPETGYRDVYERSQDVIRNLEPEARRLGVAMAIENVWNRFLLSPLEMTRYIDEIGSPFVGAYLDVANVLTYGYPEDWLRILGARVKGIHFKDFRREIDNIRAFTHLLHGDVDWPAVAAALRDIGYQGYVTVEVPPLRVHPEKGLRDARSSLDLILGNLLG